MHTKYPVSKTAAIEKSRTHFFKEIHHLGSTFALSVSFTGHPDASISNMNFFVFGPLGLFRRLPILFSVSDKTTYYDIAEHTFFFLVLPGCELSDLRLGAIEQCVVAGDQVRGNDFQNHIPDPEDVQDS